MQKYIFVVLILMLAACAPRVRHIENGPKQASPPVTPPSVSPSTNIPASPSVNNVLSTPSTAIDPDSIPATFFAINTVNPDDYPKLTFGTLSHPEIGAWAWIEKSKGIYDFNLFDKYISDAAAHGLVDGTKTVNMTMTLGETPPWAASDPKSCKTNKGFTWCTSGPRTFRIGLILFSP